MRNMLCVLIFLLSMVSCRHTTETEYIILPFHTDSTEKTFTYLVDNPPSDSLQLLTELIAFYKINALEYYKEIPKGKKLSVTSFYIKNRRTSYFLTHPDDSGGFSSEVLQDYYYGEKDCLSGLATIYAKKCTEDSTKWTFRIHHCVDREKSEWENDILRDECQPGWYAQHKENDLVKLFNASEPYEFDD